MGVPERYGQWGAAFYVTELDNGCNFSSCDDRYDFLGIDSFRAGQYDSVLVFSGYGGHRDRRPAGNLT